MKSLHEKPGGTTATDESIEVSAKITAKLCLEVWHERSRQLDKFGHQTHLTPSEYLTVLQEEVGEVARAIIDGDLENYREELIQVATVALAMVEESF